MSCSLIDESREIKPAENWAYFLTAVPEQLVSYVRTHVRFHILERHSVRVQINLVSDIHLAWNTLGSPESCAQSCS